MVLEKVEETATEKGGMSHKALASVAVMVDRLSKVVLEEREEKVEGMADRLSKVVLEETVVTGMWNMEVVVDKGMAQDMVAEDWDKGKNR